MNERIEKIINYLREINFIIIPFEFTYLNHCTSFIPMDIKERMKNGKYIRNWTKLPVNEFVIKRSMSFSERDDMISETLSYRHPLSDMDITYQLPDYSKPFIIRVILPKRELMRQGKFEVNEDYQKDIERIYIGGDYRHPKIFNNEKIYIIGYGLKDEISKKKIDIFYGVREKDLELYYKYVLKTINTGYKVDPDVQLSTHDELDRFANFYPFSYIITKSADRSRYVDDGNGKSAFERELLDDYKDDLCDEGELLTLKDHYKYYCLYNDYGSNNEKKK